MSFGMRAPSPAPAMRDRTRARAVACIAGIAVVLAIASASSATHGAAEAATASVTVSMTVSSATWIDAAGCSPGTGGVTDFGTLLPDTQSVSAADCVVKFAANNDTASLRIAQADGVGRGMWAPSSGMLDNGFDGPSGTGNGIFNDWFPVPAGFAGFTDLAIESDGDILAIANCVDTFFTDYRACMARYLATTGARDLTFDGPTGTGNGQMSETYGQSRGSAEKIQALSDGRILTLGVCGGAATDQLCMSRYDQTGAYDVTFDGPGVAGNGRWRYVIGGAGDGARDMAVQPDGKVVVVARCTAATADFCVFRFTETGALDPSFVGPSGVGSGSFVEPIGTGYDIPDAVALQPDGKIVVAGTCWTGTVNNVCLARYMPDGTRDVGFDGPSGTGNGEFIEPIGTLNDAAASVAIQPDGRILVGATCRGAVNDDFCFARYQANGLRDATFDGPSGTGDGEFIEPISADADTVTSIAVLPDGRILAGGSCGTGANDDLCTARYDATGSRDVSWDGPGGAGNGEVIQDLGSDDNMVAIRVGIDGQVLAGGTCVNACIARYDAAGRIDDYLDDGSADFDTVASLDLFGACLRDATDGAAAATWPEGPGNACPASDGLYWKSIPTIPTKIASTAAPDALGGATDPAARLRFGVRTALNTAPGTYIAPIVFDVVAPA